MPRGSLENLLKSKCEREKYANVNCELNDRELLKIALQIASGMQHLEERKVRTSQHCIQCTSFSMTQLFATSKPQSIHGNLSITTNAKNVF